MLDPVTLPMTIPDLRVEGAPVLVTTIGGRIMSGTFLSYEAYREQCSVWFGGMTQFARLADVRLNLHHPNGERIADLVLRPEAPSADRETLEAIRDAVLRAVSA